MTSDTPKKPGPAKAGPGRPKGSKTRKLMRDMERDIEMDLFTKVKDLAEGFSERMLVNLAEIALDPEAPAGVRVTASNAILDRSIGKAPQHQNVRVTGGLELTGILRSIAEKGVDINAID